MSDQNATMTETTDAPESTDAPEVTVPIVDVRPLRDLSVTTDADAIRARYADADGKAAKAAIRTFVESAKNRALDNGDMATAIAARELGKSLVTVKSAKASLDYVELIARRAVELSTAAQWLIETGPVNELPDDVEVDLDAVARRFAELSADYVASIPDTSATAINNLMAVKWGTKAPKSDVAAHIAEWRDTVEPGTFVKIGTLAAFPSAAYAGKSGKHDGAVAAHLFGNGENAHDGTEYDQQDVTGVQPVAATGNRPRGVVAV
jgi:hypothetical protein